MENIGSLGSCLVGDDALVIPNVIRAKVVDEQSLVQQMNVCLGTFFQVVSLERGGILMLFPHWLRLCGNYNLVNQKGFFSRNCITGRDRIFNNPSFKRDIQRVVLWPKHMEDKYPEFVENICKTGMDLWENMKFLVLPKLTKIFASGSCKLLKELSKKRRWYSVQPFAVRLRVRGITNFQHWIIIQWWKSLSLSLYRNNQLADIDLENFVYYKTSVKSVQLIVLFYGVCGLLL